MSRPASWIADEYGSSYLNNPQQQNRDFAAARNMATLIKQTVQAKGGDAQRTGVLIDETLDELRGRAPFSFVTPAFALGTTQVLLDRANQMSGPDFVKYLEGIKDRDNPLFFWQKTTLDPLMDEVKNRTSAHVNKLYGKSTFAVFEGMKGQHGPLAYSAGAADAVLNEVGSGTRGMLLAASNPLEAGRQVIDMGRNLDSVPEALKQQFREADKLIEATQLDDYHKGYLHARLVLIVLDVKDVVDVGMSLTNLAQQIRKGNVHNIGDATRALDEGPNMLRPRDGDTPNGNPGRNTPPLNPEQPQRGRIPDPVEDPAVRLQRQIDQTRRESSGSAVVFKNGIPIGVDGSARSGLFIELNANGRQFIAEIRTIKAKDGREYLGWGTNDRVYPLETTDKSGRPLSYFNEDGTLNRQAVAARIVDQLNHRAASPDALVPKGQWAAAREVSERVGTVGNAIIWNNDIPYRVHATKGTGVGFDVQVGGQTMVAEFRYAKTSQGLHPGWGTNDRWYPIADLETTRDKSGNIDIDRIKDRIQSDIDRGLAKQDALVSRSDWERRYPEQARQQPESKQQPESLPTSEPNPSRPSGGSTSAMPPDSPPPRTPGSAFLPDELPGRGGPQSSDMGNGELHDRGPTVPTPMPPGTPGIPDGPLSRVPGSSPPDALPPKAQTPTTDGGGTSAMPPGTPDGPPPRTPRSDALPPTAETPPRDRPPSAENPPSNLSGGMGGGKTPGDRPVAGGNPDDPKNQPGDGTPTPRQQDVDLTRPRTFSHSGKQWDIIGVNDGNPPSLELVSQNAVPRFVPTDALLPRAPDGQLRPREVSLVQTNGKGEVTSREAYTVVGVEDNGLRISRNGENGAKVERVVAYNAPNTEVRFDFPNGANYAAKQTVNGSVRFEPVGAERATVEIVPGMRFEARLQGRELEGSRLIEMNPRGELFARNPENALATPERISISDVAPTWQKVTSTTAPGADLYMDSANYRRAGLRSGRDGESLDNIGTIDGQSKIQHGFANQIYKPVLEALRNPATTGDVSIAMYGIGTSLDGKRYTEALLKYADTHPSNKVTIHSGDVQINGRTGEDLKAWLAKEHPNITITEPPAPSNFRVPHEKIVAIGDQVFISSEKIGMTMSRKIGFMTELGGEDAQLMHKYIQQLGDPKAVSSERSQVLGKLAERGVLIDDPIAGHYPNAAAMSRTITEAQGHLRIFQSDVSDVEAAKLIAKRAESGIPIDLKYRGIDPESKRILDEAAERFPNLKHQLVAANGPLSPIYQHENFVLSEKGGVLSSAYMWEPKAQQVPRYTNGGEGGVLLNADQARQYEQFLNQSPTREIGPRAVLNEIEEALKKPDLWPKLWEVIEQKLPWNRNQASAIDSPQLTATAQSQTSNIVSLGVNAGPDRPQEERVHTLPANLSQSSALVPTPPQAGDVNFIAYQQSTKAADQLNASLNLPRSEATEKLVVAAATLGVMRDHRVDEIALNKPTATEPGGMTAFVIEKTGNSETDRVSTLSMPEVMQMQLDEGYRALAQAAPVQTLAQNPQPTQTLGQEDQQAGRKLS